jgi:hypothetical protein
LPRRAAALLGATILVAWLPTDMRVASLLLRSLLLYARPPSAQPQQQVTCGNGASASAGQSASFLPGSATLACYPCQNGTYSAAALAPTPQQCSPCTVGYSCQLLIGAAASTLLPCAAGTYSAGSSAECRACEVGYGCPGASGRIPCPPGTYTGDSAHACAPCEPGYACPGQSNRTRCLVGSAPNALLQATRCAECAAGTAAGIAAHSCANCTAGRYAAQPRASNCTACVPGQYSMVGEAACTVCPSGSRCVGGAGREPCAVGTGAGRGQVVCLACPVGGYGVAGAGGEYGGGPAGAACASCPEGRHHLRVTILTSRSLDWLRFHLRFAIPMLMCVPWSRYTSSSGVIEAAGGCRDCPVEHYCPGGTDKLRCVPGNYNEQPKQASCLPCAAGKISPGSLGEHGQYHLWDRSMVIRRLC